MPVSKKPVSRKPATKATPTNPEEMKQLIAETAYYLAEQRGFEGEYHLHDWLDAESKIERIYGKLHSN